MFIELLRRNFQPGLDVFYYRTRNNREVDFVLRKGHTVWQLIQVSYDVSHKRTLKRETNALIEAAGELACSNLLLISWDTEETITIGKYNIHIIPAYKWLSAGQVEP